MDIEQILRDAREVVGKLRALAHAVPAGQLGSEDAKAWTKLLELQQEELSERTPNLVFIGAVGVGKSSIVSVLSELMIERAPISKQDLREVSLLETGSGRTTLCEVTVERSAAQGLTIQLEAIPPGDMNREIKIVANVEWRRRSSSSRRADEETTYSREIHRGILRMTGYAERWELVEEDGHKKRRAVRPLESVIPRFQDEAALHQHLMAQANLDARNKTVWSWPDISSAECRRDIKGRLEALNQGSDPEASLPSKLRLMVENPLPGCRTGSNTCLIDTRGLDGAIAARRDLLDHLRNPNSVIVLCSSFSDAPAESVRSVLRTLSEDAQLRPVFERMLLVLVDQGQSDQVYGAEDRSAGQEIKIGECHDALDTLDLPCKLLSEQVIAFDALQDDRMRLIEAIDIRFEALWNSRALKLSRDLAAARGFLAEFGPELDQALRQTIDARIQTEIAKHGLMDSPLADPLLGLRNAIRLAWPASVVLATCRRNGSYVHLDLYAAIQSEAARAATQWLSPMIAKYQEILDSLREDSEFQTVVAHLHLRGMQLLAGKTHVIETYSQKVASEVRSQLERDTVWQQCADEWGKGTGFKDRVLAHFDAWVIGARLTEHLRTTASSEIPLVVEAPRQTPRFTLRVRNLRALRNSEWTPEPLSALIGANGSGKSTLLVALRFLRLAYERELTEAVVVAFGGASNLRTQGVSDEPVAVAICIDECVWRIELRPHDGAIEVAETFLQRGHEVFARDWLGNLSYRGERVEFGSSKRSGLRLLVDRGIVEPSLQMLASFVTKISFYSEPDIYSLRVNGSRTAFDAPLRIRGENVLPLLRSWHLDRSQLHRYEFVIEGMCAAFPHHFAAIDFVEAGNALAARIYRPGQEVGVPLSDQASGIVQMMVLLCEIASSDEGVVAIDEPENSLHPFALRRFLARADMWSRKQEMTVIIATHSTVLLDEMRADQIYVMDVSDTDGPQPTRLDELFNEEWLAKFKLGDLYGQGEIGSNRDG